MNDWIQCRGEFSVGESDPEALCRVGVQFGTASPTSDQLLNQAEVYKMIIESYKQNIPEAQQCGITLWTLSDNASEHEYWLKDDAPNLYDANYGRKISYKYVCDAIAGKDISEDFSGLDWKKQY